MLVIVYDTGTNPEKRYVWDLAQREFTEKIDPSKVVQILSTSFETTFINKEFGYPGEDWRGEDAVEIFKKLLEFLRNTRKLAYQE